MWVRHIYRLLAVASCKLFMMLGWTRLGAVCAARATTAQLRPARSTKQSILISGVSRVGKSTLANKLSIDHGYQHLVTDFLKWRFYSINDYQVRREFREVFYSEILKTFPRGLIIEGNDLIYANRGSDKVSYEYKDLQLDLLEMLSRSFSVPAFIIGNYDTSITRKRIAIQNHRQPDCWTATLSEVELSVLVSYIISASGFLRHLCDGKSVKYIEIDSDNFEMSIASAAERIAELVEMCGEATGSQIVQPPPPARSGSSSGVPGQTCADSKTAPS